MDSDDLIGQTLALPGGELHLRQPLEGVELPDDGDAVWAPLAPYWAVLWRSGVALARELAGRPLEGLRVVELGCGMGVPSLVASRRGASVLATDASAEALELLAANAARNGLALETARVDWARPARLLEQAPFDLAFAADVLYEPGAAELVLDLLPRLAPRTLLADPGRPLADALLADLRERRPVETQTAGEVSIHTLG